MYTTQVDLYEIIKRFTEPARTPKTLIFVIYLRFRPARVLAFFGRFRGPSSGPPGRFLGPPSATPLPTQKARNPYFYNVLALGGRLGRTETGKRTDRKVNVGKKSRKNLR